MKKTLMSVLAAALLAGTITAEEITVMNFAQPQEKEILDKVVRRFEDTHPGTTVKLITVAGNEYQAKIQAALSANKLPDVFYMGPESVRLYVDNQKVLDLAPYVKNAKGADFNDLYSKAVDAYRYDGITLGAGDAIWALPKDFGPFAFGYNKTLFQKKGIPLPSTDKPYTWQEFMDVCTQLTDGTSFGTGLNVNWAFIQFVWGNGTDFLDATGTKVNITDPKFIEAFQFWANMTLGGTVDGKKYNPVTPSAAQAASLDTYQRWLKGELGFFPVGPWDLAAFNTPGTLKDGFEYDLIPWPVHRASNKTATYRGGIGWAVSANTAAKKEAAELALFLSADKEANRMYCDMDLQIPNLKSLANNYTSKPGFPANRKEFLNIIESTGRSWPYDGTYTRAWYDMFFRDVQLVLDGKETADSYCKRLQPLMQKELDKALGKKAAAARKAAAKKGKK